MLRLCLKQLEQFYSGGGYTKQFINFPEDEAQDNTYKVFLILCT